MDKSACTKVSIISRITVHLLVCVCVSEVSIISRITCQCVCVSEVSIISRITCQCVCVWWLYQYIYSECWTGYACYLLRTNKLWISLNTQRKQPVIQGTHIISSKVNLLVIFYNFS